MSVSLPTTPLAAPPTLEIDLGGSASHPLERDGLHDSPASLASLSHQQQQQPSGGSRAGPVPHSGAPNSDTASFIDLGDDAKLPHSPSDSSSALSQTQRIFAQLDRIKLIQSRIAHTHSTLERIPAIAALAAAEAPRAGAAPPPATTTPDKEGGLGLGDRTKEQRERVAKAYEESAEAFARRDEGVEGIMAQLNDLSTALKTLHSLPSPCLFPRDPSSPSSSASASHVPSSPRTPAPHIPLANPPTKSDTDPVGAQDERERRDEALRVPGRARARTGLAEEVVGV